MNFCEAFDAAVNDGERIQRIGWNDGRLWVRVISGENGMQPYLLAEEIKASSDYMTKFVYHPSTQDLFAKDWITYNGSGK